MDIAIIVYYRLPTLVGTEGRAIEWMLISAKEADMVWHADPSGSFTKIEFTDSKGARRFLTPVTCRVVRVVSPAFGELTADWRTPQERASEEAQMRAQQANVAGSGSA